MIHSRKLLAAALAAVLSGGVALAGSVTSGPQAGDKVPGPFKPLNVTGPDAGQQSCQYCKNGARPVAVVFAPQLTPAVARLLKQIDTATAANRARGLGSYAVLCTEAAGMDRQLQTFAQQWQIQNTVLTLYKAGGPERYRINPEAEATVLLYNHLTVKANHACKGGELNDAAINAILADLNKMLAEE